MFSPGGTQPRSRPAEGRSCITSICELCMPPLVSPTTVTADAGHPLPSGPSSWQISCSQIPGTDIWRRRARKSPSLPNRPAWGKTTCPRKPTAQRMRNPAPIVTWWTDSPSSSLQAKSPILPLDPLLLCRPRQHLRAGIRDLPHEPRRGERKNLALPVRICLSAVQCDKLLGHFHGIGGGYVGVQLFVLPGFDLNFEDHGGDGGDFEHIADTGQCSLGEPYDRILAWIIIGHIVRAGQSPRPALRG